MFLPLALVDPFSERAVVIRIEIVHCTCKFDRDVHCTCTFTSVSKSAYINRTATAHRHTLTKQIVTRQMESQQRSSRIQELLIMYISQDSTMILQGQHSIEIMARSKCSLSSSQPGQTLHKRNLLGKPHASLSFYYSSEKCMKDILQHLSYDESNKITSTYNIVMYFYI